MNLVLDTSAYVGFARGHEPVVAALARKGTTLWIPAVVLGELRYGFLKGTRAAWNEEKLGQVMKELDIRVIDVDEDVTRKYAVVYLSLEKKGTKIPVNDVWIAASCLSMGGTLLTSDRHFEAVETLDLMLFE
ncbi:MAG: type II toxin-antitoxin system VapC family toxin [Acidobacteria bacterium]|nr:type II toxin-antitoxin system VapC family toxin [Acidobacteriota bacterium]